MKRVFWFGSYGKECVSNLNRWLKAHPEIELVDIKPLVDKDDIKSELFCVLEIPENISTQGWNKKELLALGLEED